MQLAYFLFALGTSFLLLNIPNAFAEQFVCPNTYQTVMTGYTMAQVTAACGVPTNQSSVDSQTLVPIKQIQWVYVETKNPLGVEINPTRYTPQLTITFQDNKVTEITTNTQTVNNQFPCFRNNQINIGDTSAKVQIQCGIPRYVNTIEEGGTRNVIISQWTYNFGPYRPEIIFMFHDNTLAEIKMGQMAK